MGVKNTIYILVGVNILISSLLLLMVENGIYFWNFQIVFVSSSIVILASIISYKNMVKTRVELNLSNGYRDSIDKIDDPYDLYGEESKQQKSVIQTLKNSKPSFSFYRLGGYSLFILGFFYLNNNNILDVGYYLISLSLPIIVIVATLSYEIRKNNKP